METSTSTGQVEVKKPKLIATNKIPIEILEDPLLNEVIKALPDNYNFEIHKSIWRLNEMKKLLGKDKFIVHLQFPEGLLHYSCMIADILKNFTACDFIISGDVTYGACCVDDFTAEAVGAEFIIHYGRFIFQPAHSCLVPINEMKMKVLYVFVDILIDTDHFVKTFELNFNEQKSSKKFYFLSTIQFNASLFKVKEILERMSYQIMVPQEKPRCAGETLGCTSPVLDLQESDTVLYLCDGRFHMEAVMIANPKHTYYQYNPYTKLMSIEKYDFDQMMEVRQDELKRSKLEPGSVVGVIMGVLGRQGSNRIVDRIINELQTRDIKTTQSFRRVGEFLNSSIQFFVQVACPRLSIDWGKYFDRPLLTPYEFYTLVGKANFSKEKYPMDYYSDNGGEWTNYYHKKKDIKKQKKLAFEA